MDPKEEFENKTINKDRVHDVAEAERQAYEVKALVGEKIDAESRKLNAMQEFPGMEDKIAEAADRIKKLYEEAEASLEGKKWADVLKTAFAEVDKSQNEGFSIHEYFMNLHALEKLAEFMKYIEVKFGPKLNFFEKVGPDTYRAGNYSYLPIKKTGYVFRLEMSGKEPIRAWLQKVTPEFLEGLKESGKDPHPQR